MTFHFINTKDQSLVFDNFFPFAFENVIAYYQVADRVRVFSSLFFSPSSYFRFLTRQQLFSCCRSWLCQMTSVAINDFLFVPVFHNF